MRKIILIALAALMLCSAASEPVRTYRLTVVNKSGLPLGMQLVQEVAADETPQQYYLTIPSGSHRAPASPEFDLLSGDYRLTVYYIELHDPVYGNTCSARSSSLSLNHNQRLLVLECTRQPPNKGEPQQYKLYNWPNRGPR